MGRLLEGRRVSKWFGGVRALDGVDFHLAQGEILGLIGPNGAGKTTLINVVSGTLPASSGEILFQGKPITGLRAHEIARLGIARGFQISRAFVGMTVEENILVGALFGTASGPAERRARMRRVEKILDFLGLKERRADPVQALNVPDRKKVDLGRALAMDPEVLLLDELMAGLNPADMEGMMSLSREINREGVSLIIIEHVMRVIVRLCQRVMVLHQGQEIAEGTPESVMRNTLVMEAYLGPKYREEAMMTRPGTR